MKSILLPAALIFVLVSCGGNADQADTIKDTTSTSVTDTSSAIPVDTVFGTAEIPGDEMTFNFTAYIDDPDTEGKTNVRETPGGKVITALPASDTYSVNIVAQSGEWFQVNEINGFDTESVQLPGGTGWIHNSVLAFTTRNYGTQKANLYQHPDVTSKVIFTFQDERYMRFTSLHTDFVFVKYDDNGTIHEGWLENQWVCGSPVTTCP